MDTLETPADVVGGDRRAFHEKRQYVARDLVHFEQACGRHVEQQIAAVPADLVEIFWRQTQTRH